MRSAPACLLLVFRLSVMGLALGPALFACAAPKAPAEAAVARAGADRSEAVPPGPLLWRIESTSGRVSHILAALASVSGEQLIPEIWELFEAAQEVIIEHDSGQAGVWLQSLEPVLSSRISEADFQELLIAIPHLPVDTLQRFPPYLVATALHAPISSPGLPIMLAVQARAQSENKTLSFLVTDLAAYQETFSEFLGDLTELRQALDDPEPGKRLARAMRRAYLQGDADGVNAKRELTPEMIAMLEIQNEAWLEPLTGALDRGNVFAVISSADLLSGNGILERLQARGYAVERAFPGVKPSMRLPAPQRLRIDECVSAFAQILTLARPEVSEHFAQNPADLKKVLVEDGGRTFMTACRQQVTDWRDCLFDATDLKEAEACDVRHPIEN